MTTPSATVIADSCFPGHGRVATIELVHHRFILAETNTHSHAKSSASSRARPLRTVLKELVESIAFPVEYGINQSGMQARRVLVDWERDLADWAWERGAMAAIQTSLELAGSPALVEDILDRHGIDTLRSLPGVYLDRDTWLSRVQSVIDHVFDLVAESEGNDDSQTAVLDIHKQISNRPLEPYTWHTAVHTAHVEGPGSSWDNLLALRASPEDGSPTMAQPEFVVLADAVRDALNASEPRKLKPGEWHMPYIRDHERGSDVDPARSTARVARTSYTNQAGIASLDDDLRLFLRLATATPPHAAPFEQVTIPAQGRRSTGRIPGWIPLRHHPHHLDRLIADATDIRRHLAAVAGTAAA